MTDMMHGMKVIDSARLAVAVVAVLCVAAVFPLIVHAQDQQAALRAQIKSAILSDPRSAQLSEEELTTLVDALAGKAEAQGVAADFIPPPTTFTPPPSDTVGVLWGFPITQGLLYAIILFSLAIAMVSLKKFLHLHGSAPTLPPAVL